MLKSGKNMVTAISLSFLCFSNFKIQKQIIDATSKKLSGITTLLFLICSWISRILVPFSTFVSPGVRVGAGPEEEIKELRAALTVPHSRAVQPNQGHWGGEREPSFIKGTLPSLHHPRMALGTQQVLNKYWQQRVCCFISKEVQNKMAFLKA